MSESQQINIKPLSVNEAWKGRRFKTPAYKSFERAALLLLPKKIDIPEGDLSVTYEFGFSSKGSDFDNAIKPIQDILQKKYGFNDNRIIEAIIRKRHVKKGAEFIRFEINAVA